MERPRRRLKNLTRRQSEVFIHFLKTSDQKLIAQEINATPTAVRNNLAGIYRRLNIRSRSEALEIGNIVDHVF